MNRDALLHSGNTFEFRIMDELRVAFPRVKLLHDLNLWSDFLQKDTQIDVVAVTEFGVFVIEAKNWKFWVKGSYNDAQWTGMSSARKVMTVFNPVHQNLIHIRALKNRVRRAGFTPAEFFNFVVLPDGTQINSLCSEVINLSSLRKELLRVARESDKRCDVNQQYMYLKLVAGR